MELFTGDGASLGVIVDLHGHQIEHIVDLLEDLATTLLNRDHGHSSKILGLPVNLIQRLQYALILNFRLQRLLLVKLHIEALKGRQLLRKLDLFLLIA